MKPATRPHASTARLLLVLWLGGTALRMTVLAIPPLLPRIHHDIGLDETAVGALSSLPVLLLAAASVFGSLLIARVGARRAMIGGLVLVAFAGGARGLGSSVLIIFSMTFLMGIGIAVGQPSLPSLVRLWLPSRTGVATAVYSNGFLVGEVVAAAFTVPLVLPLVGGSWQRALVAWSAVVLLIAIAFLLFTPHVPREHGVAPLAWWPDWRDSQIWRLGLILGGASVAYFGSNAFIPDYLRATHHAAYIPAALTCLNVSQLPASFIAAFVPRTVIGKRWPIVVVGCLAVISAAGFAMGSIWVVVWAAPLGFSTAAVLVLILALPPLMAQPNDVHRMSAAVFTISYACSFLGSYAGGAIWDATGLPFSSFLPVILSGAVIATLAVRLDLSAASAGLQLNTVPSESTTNKPSIR
jgi:MFS transporter, CP family, cyanate transporter